MKVLVYGYAFPGSDRIRLNTVLLNPVSLLCLYLYYNRTGTTKDDGGKGNLQRGPRHRDLLRRTAAARQRMRSNRPKGPEAEY